MIWTVRRACPSLGHALAYQGDTERGPGGGRRGHRGRGAELGGFVEGLGYAALARAALAAGDVAAAAMRARRPGSSSVPSPSWRQCQRYDGPGRAGARGSDRGPTLGRRSRRGDDRLAPVAGADDARARGDRAG